MSYRALMKSVWNRFWGALPMSLAGLTRMILKIKAQVMWKFYGTAGLKLGPGMEEVICRLEAGEDPDRIEEEKESLLEEEVPFTLSGKMSFRNIPRYFLPPEVGEILYKL